uniref:Uncharacterized protein n=1 Tax=viral metagenome TaxID=1070528 RepID=A0A6C0DQS4_9ZZZZ
MDMTTRIADLPENITMQMPNAYASNMMNSGPNLSGSGGGSDQGVPTNYIPINIHPNPYGISAQNPILPNPIQTSSPNQQQQQQQQQQQYQQQIPIQQQMSQEAVNRMDYENMPQRRLPSRDIPIDKSDYLHDEEIQANYIPKPKLTGDYVREHAGSVEKKIEENEKRKYKESKLDQLLSEFQIPIMICFLYFVFQLPIMNTLLFKKVSFLSIYNADGHFNIYGLLLKSILFGNCFYLLTKITDFISSF